MTELKIAKNNQKTTKNCIITHACTKKYVYRDKVYCPDNSSFLYALENHFLI